MDLLEKKSLLAINRRTIKPIPLPMIIRIFLMFQVVVGGFVVVVVYVVVLGGLVDFVACMVVFLGKLVVVVYVVVIGWIVPGSRVGFNSFLLIEQFLPSQENVI